MRPELRRPLLACAAAIAAICGTASTASAWSAAGVLEAGPGTLALFDTEAPQTFTALRPITGLQPDERVEAIDFRDRSGPAAGDGAAALYGIGVVHGATDTARLYRIDLGTGVATSIGAAIAGLPASDAWDVDFDPVSDQLRVVNDADLNMRIAPATGAAVRDADVSPGARAVGAIAYDEERGVQQRVATLNALTRHDEIGRLGGWQGAPSANGGALSLTGAFGVASAAGSHVGFDYTPYDPADPWDAQVGFATVTTAPSSPGLYRLQYTPLSGPSLGFLGDLAGSLRAFATLPAMTVEFPTAAIPVSERDRATVTVTRSGPATSTATVEYATGGGTATPGADYAPVTGVLTFAPGETFKTFEIPLVDDGVAEDDESVEIALRDPSAPLSIGSRASTALTIRDADGGLAPPKLRLSGMPASISLARLLRRGVRVTVTPSKPAVLDLQLTGTARRAQISRRGSLVLARAVRRSYSSAPATLTLRPLRRLVGRPRHDVRLRVTVVARDAIGQRTSASKPLRVRVGRR